MQTLSQAYTSHETARAAFDFVEIGRWSALARGRNLDALMLARKANASPRVLMGLQEKANPLTTATAEALLITSQGFIQSLQAFGLYDAMVPFSRQFPLNVRISVVITMSVGDQINEAEEKTLSELELSQPTLLPKKTAVNLILADELMRLTPEAGRSLIEENLRRAVALASDEVLRTELLDGLVAIPSIGDPLSDVRALIEAIPTDATSRLFIGTSGLNQKRLAFAQGTDGGIAFPGLSATQASQSRGITFVPSNAILDTELIAFDAGQLATAPGTVISSGSGEALFTANGTSHNAFQENKEIQRAERLFGVEKIRDSAASYVTGVDYGGS